MRAGQSKHSILIVQVLKLSLDRWPQRVQAEQVTSKCKASRDALKGAVGSADLKISKSALLSLNHHNFSNTKPIYTE